MQYNKVSQIAQSNEGGIVLIIFTQGFIIKKILYVFVLKGGSSYEKTLCNFPFFWCWWF